MLVAYSYYEELQLGLGDRFLREVLDRYNDIRKHPQYYGFMDEQRLVRDVTLKGFPYLAVYKIKDDAVIVYSIHHGHRHPDKRFRK